MHHPSLAAVTLDRWYKGINKMSPFALLDLPSDVLPPILAQLSDRRDWHACALVSKIFNRAATPLLYRTLDSRIISKSLIHHPSATLLKRPDLARYVRNVTETGAVHRACLPGYPNITKNTLKALALCKNLESLTWIDDNSAQDPILLSFLTVVRLRPLREITIRTHSDLGEQVWAQLITLTGLRKISIWCMEGPPRVLQGWSESLGDTLTHLELGRCAGVPSTVLIIVLSQLPKLKDLRLKGAPAIAIPTILSYLLHLQSLDTEYPGAHTALMRRPSPSAILSPQPRPVLRNLTVRTSSMDNFFQWVRELVPNPGLETFKLHAFTVGLGLTNIPRMFIINLARVHENTLKHFIVGEAQLTLKDIECLCSMFPKLESLVCAVDSPDIGSIKDVVASAKNLQTLRLHVQWIPYLWDSADFKFTVEQATEFMLRTEDSQLRAITIGAVSYTGKWVLAESESEDQNKASMLKFQVSSDVAEDRWQT